MKQTRKFVGITILLILTGFIIFSSWRYINAVFGAIILSAMIHPLYDKLKTKMSDSNAASLTILVSLIILVIPLFLLATLLLGQLSGFQSFAEGATQAIEKLPFLNSDSFGQASIDIAQKSAQFTQQIVVSTIGGVTNFVLVMFLTCILLFYLLTSGGSLSKACIDFLPYSKKGHLRILNQFKRVVQASVVSTSVIALLQGLLIGLAFWALGMPAPVLWGFVGAIVSFLPVAGTAIVWIPGIIYLLIQQNYPFAIILLIWGLFLSNVDNFIRPMINKKVGDLHPLVSLWGVFIGIPIFGFLGIFIGPLILSVTLLLFKLHKEEFYKK